MIESKNILVLITLKKLMFSRLCFILIFFHIFVPSNLYSQGSMPIYFDYLSDNYYLLHPSMAGIANCTKLRLTARKQWIGQSDAPDMQTLSINGRFNRNSALGTILFNDSNGYSSQQGMKFTYAYHIMLSQDEQFLKQFSFGLNVGYVNTSLDESEFLGSGEQDPIATLNMKEAAFLSTDVGMSYNYLNFSTYFTIQNIISSNTDTQNEYDKNDSKNYILGMSYIFGKKDGIYWEPSYLLQYKDISKDKSIDINLKAYKEVSFGRLWATLSYRNKLDFSKSSDETSPSSQRLQYITPILGVNYKQFMFAYTYTFLTGQTNFDNGGFHQITLGMDVFCMPQRFKCFCPSVKSFQ